MGRVFGVDAHVPQCAEVGGMIYAAGGADRRKADTKIKKAL
jgi:hypothetical protein